MSDRPRPPNPSLEPDAPATAEEIDAAERLRDALEAGAPDAELLGSLRAAWSPDPIDDAAHAAILDELPASADEVQRAAELRDALERGLPEAAGDDASLLVSLRAAHRPDALDAGEHADIVDRALERRAEVVPLRPRTRRVAVVTTTVTLLAAAASVLFWVDPGSRTEAPLARARSTQPLFDEPFKPGETSARIDRIVLSRAADYRENRFAKWGVR